MRGQRPQRDVGEVVALRQAATARPPGQADGGDAGGEGGQAAGVPGQGHLAGLVVAVGLVGDPVTRVLGVLAGHGAQGFGHLGGVPGAGTDDARDETLTRTTPRAR